MNKGSVETSVSRFLARYKITPQTLTGVSPVKLLLGRKPRSRLELVYPEIGRKVRQSHASQKLARDWRAKEPTVREGEAGYASNFRNEPKWMPGVLKQLVQLLSQFNWKMDNCLEDTNTTLYRGRAPSKRLLLIKRCHHRQLNSQNYSWKNP